MVENLFFVRIGRLTIALISDQTSMRQGSYLLAHRILCGEGIDRNRTCKCKHRPVHSFPPAVFSVRPLPCGISTVTLKKR